MGDQLSLGAIQSALAIERALVAMVDPIHDTRLWDEHRTRIERLERLQEQTRDQIRESFKAAYLSRQGEAGVA